MTLQFLSDAPVEGAELVIALDLYGLRTLLRTLQTALEARLEQAAPDAEDPGGTTDPPSHAFGRVSVRIVDPAVPAAATGSAG